MRTVRDNFSHGNAGLAAGTNSGTFKTTNNAGSTIAGRASLKAATDNIAFSAMVKTPAVPFVNLAASQQCAFFVSLDAAGNVVEEQSKIAPSTTGAGYVKGAWEWPAETPTYACIGAIVVSCNASGAFTPGTTSLGAGNQTVTYVNAGPDYGVPITY